MCVIESFTNTETKNKEAGRGLKLVFPWAGKAMPALAHASLFFKALKARGVTSP